MFDGESLGRELVTLVRDFVARSLDGLATRMQALETKTLSEERVAELVHVKHMEWELDFQRRSEELMVKALASVPLPKDGKDGRDGLSLKDFDASTEDGGRTWTLSLTADETAITRTLVTAMPLDRGVYSTEQTYAKGDGVSWGGSFWIAQVDAPAGKPETSPAWRLVCKRGRDGSRS